MRQKTLICIVLALLALLPAVAVGQDYAEEILDNGLRVVTIVRSEVPMVTMTAIVGAGSALEEADFSGASHYLEHLLFNGTSELSQEELYAEVDRIGGYNNASTDDDHTYYILLVPSEHLRRGLEVQAGMLFDSTLPEDRYEKERKIVLEEIAKDRSRPDYEVDTAVRRHLWSDTPWERPVIGTYESLAGIERQRVLEYYERQYVPGNMTLLVIGDFEREEALSLIREIYGKAVDGEVPIVPDPWGGGKTGTVTRVAVEGGSPRLAIALPVPGACADGGREVQILAELLTGEAGPLPSAFGERVQEVSAWVATRRSGSALEIELKPAKGEDLESLLTEVLVVLEKVALEGLRSPGLDSTSILRVARAGRSSEKLMGQRLHYLGMLLADAVASCGGSPRRVLTEPDAVDPERIASVAAEVLGSVASKARVVLVGERSAAAEALVAPPVQIEEEMHETSGVQGADLDRTLENGLRVLVAQEKGTEVAGIHVLVRGRSTREPAGREGIADLAHRMLTEGTALSDGARLEARLQRIGADLKTADSDYVPYDDYYTDRDHSFIRLEVASDNWIPALDLLGELLRTATLPEDALGSTLAGRVRRAEKVAGSPSEVGQRFYRESMLGEEHALANSVSGTPESLGGIDREELLEFAVGYFDMTGMIISVVSPEVPDDVFGAIEERFGSAESHGFEMQSLEWPVTGTAGPAVRKVLGADQARLYFGRIAELSAENRAALSLLAAVLSDRMVMVLREQEGLAYRLGAGVAYGSDPELAWFTASIGTRAENLEAADQGIRREMDRLASEMASQEEIDRIRAAVRSRALMRRMTAINRARYLGLRAYRGVPSREDPDFLDAMDGVKIEDLRYLAKQWLDPEAFRIVIVE